MRVFKKLAAKRAEKKDKKEAKKVARKERKWAAKERRIGLRQKGKVDRSEKRSEIWGKIADTAKDTIQGIKEKNSDFPMGGYDLPEVSVSPKSEHELAIDKQTAEADKKKNMGMIAAVVAVVIIAIFAFKKKSSNN